MEDNAAPNTSNFLDWVEIKNFKSIKDLRLDCKRVNIFIGKPNVGKSNILEALGMLGAEYYEDKFMDGAVRYKNLKHLFYQNNSDDPMRVGSNISRGTLNRNHNSKTEYNLLLETIHRDNTFVKGKSASVKKISGNDSKFNNYKLHQTITENGIIQEIKKDIYYEGDFINLKKYDFAGIDEFTDSNRKSLLPSGKNLFDIIDRRNDLKNEFGKIFQQQGLDFVLDRDNQSFNLQRKDGFYIYKFDYYTIADTFRRFVFYITAIESNKNSVIVFEEPEVHSFPPYTQELAYRMVYDEDNQYFISTHSPYMLHPFIEKMDFKDLNIFVTYYEDYQTRIKALNYEEFRDILDYSTNIFFNLDRFTPNATNKVAP